MRHRRRLADSRRTAERDGPLGKIDAECMSDGAKESLYSHTPWMSRIILVASAGDMRRKRSGLGTTRDNSGTRALPIAHNARIRAVSVVARAPAP